MTDRKNFLARRGWSVTFLAAVVLLAFVAIQPEGFFGAARVHATETPVVTVSPSVVNLRKGTKVTIAGSGFPKKKEIGIRVVLGGVVSEIRSQVKPEPTVNDQGTFYTEWTFDGEQNLLDPGAASLIVVDEDGNMLAHTPVVWMKEAKKEAKKE